jgi:hypothetical protein
MKARFFLIGALAVTIADSASLAHEQSVTYSFKLDGKPFNPTVLSLRVAPDQPAPGDIIEINDMLVTLGPPGSYEYRTTPKEDGRLLQVRKDGGTDVVGASVGWTYKGREKVIFNPLNKLSPQEIRGLRGVVLDDWPEGIEDRLKHLDLELACVTISDNTAQGRKGPKVPRGGGSMPSLPEGLRYLHVRERSNTGIGDYSGLARYKALRFLTVRGMTSPVDVKSLEGTVGIRYLDLSGCELKNIASLGDLDQVRLLGLAYTRGTDNITFAAQMPELIKLDIRRTAVADLSPLNASNKLVHIDARETPVRRLPDGGLPGLRDLKIFSATLADETVEAFGRRHPGCRILFRWEKALTDALKGVDRVRVRTGGTCHRDIAREKTLFEEKRPAEIAGLVTNLNIDEKKSGFHCMCCGQPSFEFYNRNELVVTLGFHHGRSVRWPEVWPSDGALTPASAEFLCAWLSDRGFRDAKEEYERGKKEEAASRRQMNRVNAILPEALREDLGKASSPDEAVKAFEQHVKSGADRAVLALKLLGCDNGSWDHSSGLEAFVNEQLLAKAKADDVVKALAAGSADPALTGAGRWLFGEGKWESLDEKSRDLLVPTIGRHALGHPRPTNRRRTLEALGKMKGEASLLLLRSVLAEDIKIRSIPEDEQTEPGGMVTFRPGDSDLAKGTDRAFAALLLARRGDRGSFPAIRELARKAKGDDEKVLQQATALLGGKE